MNKVIKLILSPLLFLNNKVRRTNWYRNTELDKNNYPTNEWYRTHEERNYDIVNLGSSAALYAFNYTDLNVKAFNWALQPQSMEYSFKVLRNYFSILKENGIVILPFSPFSGLSVKDKWSKTTNDRYFGILDKYDIDDYEKVRKRRLYPLFYQTKTALKRLIKDVSPKGNYANICQNDKEFEQDSKRWIESWKKEFSITDLEGPVSNENLKGMKERIKLLDKFKYFCSKRNLRLIVVLTPLHPTLSNRLSQEFRNNYIFNVLEQSTLDKAEILDYTDNVCTQNIYFSNSFFLNEEGASLFTKSLLQELKIIK